MSFASTLLVREHGHLWLVEEPLTYEGARETFTVPKGYLTDFASVPRLFWNLIPPMDPHYTRAAVLHDWFYSRGGKLPDGRFVSRKDADGIFYRAMRSLGNRRSRSWLMYRAVRMFGRGSY